MSAISNKVEKDIKSKREETLSSSSSNTTPNNTVSKAASETKALKLLYQYAKQAILKGIQIGSKAFKNFLRNRLKERAVSDNDIEMALQNADFSKLKEQYIKDGEVIAKESEKYTLTAHAKERVSKANLENVTLLFNKYSIQAKEQGIRSEKQCLAYLKEKIQPRNIQTKAISDVIDAGKCQQLPGKRLKYTKAGLTVIVSERNHSIITAYRSSVAKKNLCKAETTSSQNNSKSGNRVEAFK